MHAYVRDGIEPVASGGSERREARDLEPGEEVLFDIADARLHPSLLVPGADVARHDLEAERVGEVEVAAVEDGRFARQATDHRRLQVVDHDLLRHETAEVLERVQMAAETRR